MKSTRKLGLGIPLFFLLTGLVLCAGASWAERGDDAGRQSKNGKAMGSIGGVEVTVEYGRPKVKGRELWGKLVPYDQVWRTGADEATTVTFSGNASVEGQAVDAGTYALFTIPSQGGWTVILNKVAKQWGAFRYDAGQDALRVEVKPESGEHAEELTFELDGDRLALRWGKVLVPITIAKG